MSEGSQRLAVSVQHAGVAYRRKTGLFRKGNYWALDDISFDLFHGETLGVIGRNGVGKSTLLCLLAGILTPDKGRIINYGVTLSLLSLQAGFMPNLTGRENAILSGMMLGLTRHSILGQMDAIYEYADIGEFFDQPVHCYSTGMRARLGFSVAIHVDPDVILLDEVLGVGDANFKEKSAASMREKIRSDKTIVLVSHSANMIRQHCDRALWIEHGLIRAIGDTNEVLEHYQAYLDGR